MSTSMRHAKHFCCLCSDLCDIFLSFFSFYIYLIYACPLLFCIFIYFLWFVVCCVGFNFMIIVFFFSCFYFCLFQRPYSLPLHMLPESLSALSFVFCFVFCSVVFLVRRFCSFLKWRFIMLTVLLGRKMLAISGPFGSACWRTEPGMPHGQWPLDSALTL